MEHRRLASLRWLLRAQLTCARFDRVYLASRDGPSHTARARRAEPPYRDTDRGPTMAGMIQSRPITRTKRHPGLPQPLRVVLLAADARPADRATVDRAIAIAAREHATLVALHVLPGDHGSQLRHTDGPVSSELERIVNRARRAGVEASHLVRFGDVGGEILRTARELDVDLIVVGRSPGRGHVLLHGDRPILVVHPWADVGPDWGEAVRQHPARVQAGDEAVGGTDPDERQIPVLAGRVACPLLGDVQLDRCRECDHLIEIDSGAGTTPHAVICVDRGRDYGDNLAW